MRKSYSGERVTERHLTDPLLYVTSYYEAYLPQDIDVLL